METLEKLTFQLKINPNIYLRDPQDTLLGKKIIEHSILLVDEIGIEQFTFKKLAERINSTEASIYRYFLNKHALFVYLLNWYWEWINVRIDFGCMNITDPIQKLQVIINVLVDSKTKIAGADYIDNVALQRIIVVEGTKAYHNKSVDEENKEGFFISYKNLCKKMVDVILELNKDFPYPRALASMIVEAANNNIYFAQHLPRLTDISSANGDLSVQISKMLQHFAMGIIINSNKREVGQPISN